LTFSPPFFITTSFKTSSVISKVKTSKIDKEMRTLLQKLPERTTKSRDYGITMVMDKGLSCREVEDMISVAGEYIDLVKLGFGTSYACSNLSDKIRVYKNAAIPVYFGGTLFEAFIIRKQFDNYQRALDKYGMEYTEVSDGSMSLPHNEKCRYISILSKNHKVLSEVGSKDANVEIQPEKWSMYMEKELEAGSWKLIAEARESGTVGIYNKSGESNTDIINEILNKIQQDKIIWEAPLKNQQVYFIKLLGQNVNLGNIAHNEVIPLETLRIGLRGDTFLHFANKLSLV
jgi:phosphosulfolactate synthase